MIIQGRLFFSLAVALILVVPGLTAAEDKRIGEEEYTTNCASCHGPGGKGDGPFNEFLRQTPKDLTVLSKNNDGVFPFQRIYDWIEDPEGVRGHGTQEMPIWGDRYREQLTDKAYDPFGAGFNETVRARILELVFFIASIQEQ